MLYFNSCPRCGTGTVELDEKYLDMQCLMCGKVWYYNRDFDPEESHKRDEANLDFDFYKRLAEEG